MTVEDRLSASDRAYRRSLTNISAADWTLRLTSIDRKLGAARERRTTAIVTTTINSTKVKPD